LVQSTKEGGKAGLVPANYVEPHSEEEATSAAPAIVVPPSVCSQLICISSSYIFSSLPQSPARMSILPSGFHTTKSTVPMTSRRGLYPSSIRKARRPRVLLVLVTARCSLLVNLARCVHGSSQTARALMSI